MTKDYEKSSGNVFADLGLPNPERELSRAKQTVQIYRLTKARDLIQASKKWIDKPSSGKL